MRAHLHDAMPRRTIASFDRYEDARALMDRLAEGGFPVERLGVVGSDLRIPEGSFALALAPRTVLAGAALGAAAGALSGLALSVLLSPRGGSLLVLAYGIPVGTVTGVALWLVDRRAVGAQLDTASALQVQAGRYEVVAEETEADEEVRRLSRARQMASTR